MPAVLPVAAGHDSTWPLIDCPLGAGSEVLPQHTALAVSTAPKKSLLCHAVLRLCAGCTATGLRGSGAGIKAQGVGAAEVAAATIGPCPRLPTRCTSRGMGCQATAVLQGPLSRARGARWRAAYHTAQRTA